MRPEFVEIDERLGAIEDQVVYDDTPSLKEAIRRLNTAAAYVIGLRETLRARGSDDPAD